MKNSAMSKIEVGSGTNISLYGLSKNHPKNIVSAVYLRNAHVLS